MVNEVSSIKLFRTSEHPCSYISDQNATTIFLDPATKISQKLNSALTDKGFRRSGHLLYKPDCNSCKACIACRIPVKKFKSKSSFKRILKIADFKIRGHTGSRDSSKEQHSCSVLFQNIKS